MATTANIAYQDNNGEFHWRYHHWDGFVSGLGKTLLSNFHRKEDIEFLINLNGNFSSIINDATIVDINYNNDRFDNIEYNGKIIHKYNDELASMVKNQCVKNLTSLQEACVTENFLYLFSYNDWKVSHKGSDFFSLYKFSKVYDLFQDIKKSEDYKGEIIKSIDNFPNQIKNRFIDVFGGILLEKNNQSFIDKIRELNRVDITYDLVLDEIKAQLIIEEMSKIQNQEIGKRKVKI